MNKTWRFLCYRRIAKLLGWRRRIEEGNLEGLPAEIYTFIRQKLWPNIVDEVPQERWRGHSSKPSQ